MKRYYYEAGGIALFAGAAAVITYLVIRFPVGTVLGVATFAVGLILGRMHND